MKVDEQFSLVETHFACKTSLIEKEKENRANLEELILNEISIDTQRISPGMK